MADPDDPGGLRNRLDQEPRKLDEAAGIDADRDVVGADYQPADPDEYDPEGASITEDDFRQLRDWFVHERANDNKGDHVLAARPKCPRLTSVRSNTPLTEMGRRDYDRFILRELKEKRGLTEGTDDQYKMAVRLFFRWLGEDW